MKRVFTSHDSAEVGWLKSQLEEAGIECLVRNETQAYPTAFQPELWVLREEDFAAAEELCRGWRNPGGKGVAWICQGCGEEIEGQFETCWKCGAPQTETMVSIATPAAPEKEVELPVPVRVGKHFLPTTVTVLAVLALGFELYWRGGDLWHRAAALYYPVETALWLTGQESKLQEGWKEASEARKALRLWHDLGPSDPAKFCEAVLRDTSYFVWKSDLPMKEATRLTANLVVLLGENGAWSRAAKDVEWLMGYDQATNFVRAARATYETNQQAPLIEIHDPFAILGDTWFRERFEARCLAAKGEMAESARLADSLEREAQAMHARDFAVIVVTTVIQGLGIGGLIWLLLARRKLQAQPANFAVPWSGWEGLGIFFAAWVLGILLQDIINRIPGGRTLTYFNHHLVMWLPLLALMWVRHWRQDRTSLNTLFSLAPMNSRGWMLLAAGFGVFALDWAGMVGLDSVADALGQSAHWAEGLYEAEYYEPWRVRWLVLLNGLLWAPIGEEIIFRGVLFPALRTWLPVSAAALVSGMAFALIHHYSWPGLLGLTLFGFVSALSVHFTRSLVPCIIGHFLSNLILVAGHSWVFGN